ncbi:MAG: hypothetical protein ACUVTY_10210 [Armatimonadota bacterium]
MMDYDFSRAVVVSAGGDAHRAERKSAQFLRDEVRRRAGLNWQMESVPREGVPAIVIAHPQRVPAGLRLPPQAEPPAETAEGYTLFLESPSPRAPRLWLVGNCGRASLFAVGQLLRWLNTGHGTARLLNRLPGRLISTSARFAIRGHQLGYRSTPNTYDAWNVAQYEQYIRDLLVFGANSIELIPALKPDAPRTAIMPLSPWEMNVRLSRLLDEYDLDVWVWLPNTDVPSGQPADIARMVADRRRIFESMPRLDHVFVPGGDPGDMPLEELFALLERMAEDLHRVHPHAGLWLSPQGFSRERMDAFYRFLRERQPDWLTGVVYGPWIRDRMERVREMVPARYKLRRYPDITHCVRCQYPVPEWDMAFALTLNREPINPRPIAQAHIHNLFMHLADGCITYSEGVNDDVNKAIWSARLWDPRCSVRNVLIEYGRAFISSEHAEDIAEGLLALERNWQGALLGNPRPRLTLSLWKRIWQALGKEGQSNWRLQMAYFRALYDVFVQARLEGESKQEQDALKVLEQAERLGAQDAADRVRSLLDRTYTTPEIEAMRREIHAVGEMLWKSVGMQMSVSRYHADGVERGAVLDTMDEPLNNRQWILGEIEKALQLPVEEQARALVQVARWTDPGPGGFYDDLGNPLAEPHLVRSERWTNDPGFLHSAQDEFGAMGQGYRLSWCSQASTLYGTPLEMLYTGLDPNAHYRLRVVYNGRFRATMRLIANDSIQIHGPLRGTQPPSVMEFEIPPEVTRGGILRLKWELVDGRGCQVAEVWLVRQPHNP